MQRTFTQRVVPAWFGQRTSAASCADGVAHRPRPPGLRCTEEDTMQSAQPSIWDEWVSASRLSHQRDDDPANNTVDRHSARRWGPMSTGAWPRRAQALQPDAWTGHHALDGARQGARASPSCWSATRPDRCARDARPGHAVIRSGGINLPLAAQVFRSTRDSPRRSRARCRRSRSRAT